MKDGWSVRALTHRWFFLAFAAALLSVLVLSMDTLLISDFPTLYETSTWFRHGQSPYGPSWRPQLNTPPFVAAFAVLTFLPSWSAELVWTCLGAALTVDALRRVVQAQPQLRPTWPIAACGLVGFMPALFAWHQGQVTWILTYAVTRAWLSPSAWMAGLWLAPAVVIKPPLALMALALPWPVPAWTAASSLAIVLVSMAAQGVPVWLDWWATHERIVWLGQYANLSVWGVLARLQSGAVDRLSLAQIHPAFIVGAIVAAGVLAWRLRGQSGDRRWALASLWWLLVSPLGWLYYLPVGFGPLWATWPAWRTIAVPIVVLGLPRLLFTILMHFGPAWVVVAGSAWFACTLWLFMEWSRPRARSA